MLSTNANDKIAENTGAIELERDLAKLTDAEWAIYELELSRANLRKEPFDRHNRKMVERKLMAIAGYVMLNIYDPELLSDPIFDLAKNDLQVRDAVSRMVIAEMDDVVFQLHELYNEERPEDMSSEAFEMLDASLESFHKHDRHITPIAVKLGTMGYEGIINHANWFDPELKKQIESAHATCG